LDDDEKVRLLLKRITMLRVSDVFLVPLQSRVPPNPLAAEFKENRSLNGSERVM
jgi:hypothetical protein